VSACHALTLASRLVWKGISKANQKLRVGEESLTDMVLLIAENFNAGCITCKKFTRREENKTGGDWLWFFVQSGRSYSTLMQAKKLYVDQFTYTTLKKPSRGPTQMNKLIRYIIQEDHVPLYCFYNSWPTIPNWATRQYQGKSEDWGCAVASAERVKARMVRGDNKLNTIGPLSQPWSVLVCPSRQKGAVTLPFPDRVREALVNLVGRRGLPPVREADNPHPLMDWAAATGRTELVDEPPNLAGVVVIQERE
jgi:hypothetical protein